MASLFGTTRLFRELAAWARVRPTRLWKCSFLPRGWCWEPESRTSTSFLRYRTPDWAEGEGRTVCVCGYSKKLWSVLFQINNNSFPFHQSLALRGIFPMAVRKANLVQERKPQRKRGVFYIIQPPSPVCSVTVTHC